MKFLAQQINKGLFSEDGLDDFNIIIISPLINIPPELEQYISILSLDFLGEKDIRDEITRFAKELDIDVPQTELMDKLVMTLRGLSGTEIFNILEISA